MRGESGERGSVFQRELEFLEQARQFAEDPNQSKASLTEKYEDILSKYERLLGEAKLLTSVSDRLHHKLNQANDKLNHANDRLKDQAEEIQTINEDLKVNNQVLQDTIDQLLRARVSRKASTIVLAIAILLFVVSEGVLEPIVEANTSNIYVGLSFKLLIAILLRPIDFFTEKYMMRRALKAANQARVQSV